MKLPFDLSTRIGRFAGDRRVITVFVLLGLALAGRVWLAEHPQHNPWAPLDLRDPPGWATDSKLTGLKDDPEVCRAALERSGVAFTDLPAAEAGEPACARPDRISLDTFPYAGRNPPSTCAVAAGVEYWRRHSVAPAAEEIFGSPLARIEHFGSYSCRRLYGRDSGAWSEHATGNAIDIAAFVLEDGTRVSVLGDWDGEGDKAQFLRRVRDGACNAFGTVLSPDYNEAHADHFHFDQAQRFGGVCR